MNEKDTSLEKIVSWKLFCLYRESLSLMKQQNIRPPYTKLNISLSMQCVQVLHSYK